ncbi:hypothetical protein BESB_017290 [Besnoitia besnoiti]|uniref:Uncharacterized protein n=1 Tax=Besnoitia besnoiti TaxID=94643 RepID=A0A2A9M7Z5_BESBE|nr:hypothetical protein BESB_017290 [Besnoitia besnoiti]PFH32411.1 hypothetical protein BESB_017290 [Besnoitia besnoiti]
MDGTHPAAVPAHLRRRLGVVFAASAVFGSCLALLPLAKVQADGESVAASGSSQLHFPRSSLSTPLEASPQTLTPPPLPSDLEASAQREPPAPAAERRGGTSAGDSRAQLATSESMSEGRAQPAAREGTGERDDDARLGSAPPPPPRAAADMLLGGRRQRCSTCTLQRAGGVSLLLLATLGVLKRRYTLSRIRGEAERRDTQLQSAVESSAKGDGYGSAAAPALQQELSARSDGLPSHSHPVLESVLRFKDRLLYFSLLWWVTTVMDVFGRGAEFGLFHLPAV